MTGTLLPAQKQPTGDWGRWLVTGGRRSGRTTALVVAAGQRAAVGERVAYVDPWTSVKRLPSKLVWLLRQFGIADFVVHASTGELRFPSGGVLVPIHPSGPGRALFGVHESAFIDDASEVTDPQRERALLTVIRELRHRGTRRWAEAMLIDGGALKSEVHLTPKKEN